MNQVITLVIAVAFLGFTSSSVAKNNDTVFLQAEQALADHDQTQANKLLSPLLAAHSGKANLLLAKQAVTEEKGQAAITYALQAAQYGYPESAYTLMAKLYQKGVGQVKQNDFLTACYFNLARAYPNAALTNKCLLNASGSFKVMPHHGMQNTQEAEAKAKSLQKQFCAGRAEGLFNPRLDKRTLQALEQLLCQQKNTRKENVELILKPNDLVMQEDKLYQVDENNQLSAYQSPLAIGDLVKVKQPEYQTYLFDGKQLILAKTNASIVKNNQLVYFVDGKLSLKKATHLPTGETPHE